MDWRGWEDCSPLSRLKEIERQKIEPLITAAVCYSKLADLFHDWQIEPNIDLDEDVIQTIKNKIVSATDQVYRLAHHAQRIQMTHKLDISILLFIVRRADKARITLDKTFSLLEEILNTIILLESNE